MAKTATGAWPSSSTVPLYGRSGKSAARASPADPPDKGTVWTTPPSWNAFVATVAVSPGPATASSNGIDPATAPPSKESPRLSDV